MADENKPTDKIDLASTELKIGGVNLKGSYIVWALAIAGSIAGSIMLVGGEWEKYQRVKGFVAEFKNPDLEPMIKMSEQLKALEDQVVNLSQALANNEALATRLSSEVASITKLMEANDVNKLQGAIAQLRTTVEGVQVFTRDVQEIRTKLVGIEKDLQVLRKDQDSTWNAIDQLGSGSLKGK